MELSSSAQGIFCTTFQDITSETVPTQDTEQIGGEPSLELRNENEKNPFAPKKTLVVRLMRLKILRLKAKSVNFRSKANSNDFVTIRMGTKPQTVTNEQAAITRRNCQQHVPDISESSVEQFYLERNVNDMDTENNMPPCEKNFGTINEKAVSLHSRMPRDSCLFCKKDVLCFASHVLAHHREEKEVVQITSYPINSKEQKLLMSFLKKKSNYLKKSEPCCNPTRKPRPRNGMILQCANCLGFYKQLCRHVKKCSANPTIEKIVQADALSFLFPQRDIDEDLKLKVFPRMRTDHISMVAKQDKLICDYGANFLKTHLVDTHVVHVTSRKMRELARCLIEVNKMNTSIKSLQEALQPQFYELIVEATRILGKYNAADDTYECPTFVMSIGYMLRQCCLIAITLASEKKDYYDKVNTDEAIFNLNMMIDLFGTNWKEKVLSPARNQNF